MTKVIVREMKLDDIDEIYEIEKRSFSMPWSKSSFYQEINDNLAAYYYVVGVDDTLVGYMGIWKILDEGHITNVAIDHDYRGKGYSKQLVSHVLCEMEKLEVCRFTLEVRESNIIAQKLYLKFGFSVEGRRKKYYTDTKEDALLMWLNANSED
ncbi:MAG: ribosomal protein S18-alanine N-acetyltransferase [Bacillota bacterium]|nr:ribosomal protein S18-alanine N-acetyltransferase [Bacillota bacterium]